MFFFNNPNLAVDRFLSSDFASCEEFLYFEKLKAIKAHPLSVHLLSHQVKSVAFLSSRNGAILADEMGLGKTRSSILSALIFSNERIPALIVCPTSIRFDWRDEILNVSPTSTHSLPDSPKDWRPADFTILSLSRLKSFYGWGEAHTFKSLFLDESQVFKNSAELTAAKRNTPVQANLDGTMPGLHRTQLVFTLAKKIPNVFCLTGTPILGKTRELFNLLRLIRHPLGKNFLKFSERYCGGHETPFGWKADGSTNIFELRELLRGAIFRQLKRHVLSLPSKTTVVTPVPLSGSFYDDYQNAWTRYLSKLSGVSSARVFQRIKVRHLVEINLLRQITSLSKVPYLGARIASSPTKKFLVFSLFTETLNEVSKDLTLRGIPFVRYDGSLSENQRYEAIQRFKKDPRCHFVANMDAAKAGLTLVESDHAIFLDQSWTPADHWQAEDRVHRIGQDRPVVSEYLYAPKTVEERLVDVLIQKQAIIDQHPKSLS